MNIMFTFLLSLSNLLEQIQAIDAVVIALTGGVSIVSIVSLLVLCKKYKEGRATTQEVKAQAVKILEESNKVNNDTKEIIKDYVSDNKTTTETICKLIIALAHSNGCSSKDLMALVDTAQAILNENAVKNETKLIEEVKEKEAEKLSKQEEINKELEELQATAPKRTHL